MYKKCKVVMLATDENAREMHNTKRLFLHIGKLYYNLINGNTNLKFRGQHLYILSNDEIKEGDWCLYGEGVTQIVDKLDTEIADIGNYEKIIATTDSSLTNVYNKDTVKEFEILTPSIPQSFIDKYVSEYNKGNKIEEIMVEYENAPIADYDEITGSTKVLKFNSDNTINIKSIKDSWTRDEVIEIIKKFNFNYGTLTSDELHNRIDLYL